MFKLIVITLTSLITSLSASTVNDQLSFNQIQVQVEASDQIIANSAKLYLIIENMNRDLKRAQKKNKRTIQHIKKILNKYDIEDTNITIDDYSTYPQEGFIPDSVQLSSRMMITIKDKSQVIAIAKKITDKFKAVYIEKIYYEFGSYTILKNTITKKLITQMQTRKENLEKELELKLKIGTIKEHFEIKSSLEDQSSPIQNVFMVWDISFIF